MAARVVARARLAFNWEVVEYDRPKFGHYIGIQILQTTGPNPTWVQQTHTAGLLQTWQLHDARGVRHQLPDTDVKVRRPS